MGSLGFISQSSFIRAFRGYWILTTPQAGSALRLHLHGAYFSAMQIVSVGSTQISEVGLGGQAKTGDKVMFPTGVHEEGRAWCMRVKLRVQRRPQKFGDTRKIEHLVKNATSSEWSQHEREAMWTATSKAEGRAAQVLGPHISPQAALSAGHAAIRFSICPAEFQSGFGLVSD